MAEQTTGSGAGDVPLAGDELGAFRRTAGRVAPTGSSPIHVPVLIGAVAVATRGSGVEDPARRLRFSGPTLAEAFSGEITTWSDPRIAAEIRTSAGAAR